MDQPRIIEYHPDIVLDAIDLIGIRLANNHCPACGLALEWQGQCEREGVWWNRTTCRNTVKCGFERWTKVEATL